MRLHICAVGRLRAGPEQVLIEDYLARAERTGRALGFSSCTLHQIDERKGGGKAGEAALLRKALPSGATTCALDERGRVLDSVEFAALLGKWRDEGRGDLAFLIGGADGLARDLRTEAEATLSLGKMVWPHMLARVMLCEQIYRATTILAGLPYHRV
ncbi:23S rRNA (pseudouridine1915-N3)-methyltransferase [Poseidonocella pacifica]|uniref:Ribosomal RNA large subunit methyltransferase H n=1 Tax=Poseidonocella pacifica TaxID=871651 RepID=A0A1I0WBA3_9RHOB|nr:23S rRNA (pseudouridine(1915)-N(3))-methyltransferase RlmH [Poseidonocella pacifica]SFA85548.1 23S rRNA (pseudouridine1915-N3)-methyltransferase [Poseidonocella pacifica]